MPLSNRYPKLVITPTKQLDFGEELWNEAHSSHLRENQIVSPIGADMVLSFFRIGAKGIVTTELGNNMHLPDEHTLNFKFSELMKTVRITSGSSVYVANGFYAPARCKFKKDFITFMQSKFNAEVKILDFAQTDKSLKAINKGIEYATNLKIKHICNKKDIQPDSQLVLLNAVYFRGIWKSKFQFMPGQTTQKPFKLLGGGSVMVDMMSAFHHCMYAKLEEYGCQAIGLPYEGNQFVFVVILPDDPKGLVELETSVSTNFFHTFRRRLEYWPEEIHLQLPKFTIQSRTDFIPIFKKMNIRSAFNHEANFGNFFEEEMFDGKVRFTTIIQKVCLEISEEGSDIHSHSVSVFHHKQNAISFLADHPFLFFVMDDKTDSVIVAGSVASFPKVEFKMDEGNNKEKDRWKKRISQ